MVSHCSDRERLCDTARLPAARGVAGRTPLVLLAAFCCLPEPASAQSYPTKPVRVVVAFLAGGNDDFHGRLVAQKLTEGFGQQFIVENRPGAGGLIGRAAVAKAPPDGYTLLLGGRSMMATRFVVANPGFDPVRDFAPVAFVASVQFMLLVHPTVPARNLKEFIALARARPGELNMGSAGFTSGPFLMGIHFNTMANINSLHVPYKGIEALNDLLTGRLDYYFGSQTGALPHLKTARLRALGVVSRTRSQLLPDVPTIDEAGLTGYEHDAWVCIVAPAGTPRAIVDALNGTIVRSLAMPDMRERLLNVGSQPRPSTPEELGQRMADAAETIGLILQRAKFKPQ